MNNWIAVWRTADGELISVGTADAIANPLPGGLSTTDVGPDAPTGVWNKATRTFDAAAVLKPVLSLKAFWQRFTQVERETLWDMQANGTANQKKKLGAFKDYMQACGVADLNDAYVQSSVNLMETSGVIGAGRAAVILA